MTTYAEVLHKVLKHPKSTSIIININPKMIILGIAEQKRKKWPPLKGGPNAAAAADTEDPDDEDEEEHHRLAG